MSGAAGDAILGMPSGPANGLGPTPSADAQPCPELVTGAYPQLLADPRGAVAAASLVASPCARMALR